MNKQIERLISRSYTDEQGEQFDMEKFAKLIVNECSEVARRAILSESGVDPDTFNGTVATAEKIKDYFGVEGRVYKDLTDEEIMNIAFLTTTIENDWDNTVLGFARAILKKASEK